MKKGVEHIGNVSSFVQEGLLSHTNYKGGRYNKKVTLLKELGINQGFSDMDFDLCKNALHNL